MTEGSWKGCWQHRSLVSRVPVVSADRALVTCLDTEEHTLMPELYVANWISEQIAVCLGVARKLPTGMLCGM